MNRYEGKVCLVTGGTAGIGYATAERMALEGGFVVICSRQVKNVEKAVETLRHKIGNGKGTVDGLVVNVGKSADRAKLVDFIKNKFGKLDVLVLNAAAGTHYGKQLDISEKAYDRMWDVNVKSTFFLIKESKPLMDLAGKGKNILIVSSVTGKNPQELLGVYAMTKGALDNMCIWLHKELMPDGIRVNGIAPGLILTNFSVKLQEDTNRPKEAEGRAHQIGSVAATICSDDGSFMNGEVY